MKKAVLAAFKCDSEIADPILVKAACGVWEGSQVCPQIQLTGLRCLKRRLTKEDYTVKV